MPIKGRVGRHTRDGGRHCQNWVDDQRTITALLNAIPIADGGAGGTLDGKFINGMAGDALYQAISRFEDKYWPGQRSGYVDPNGEMFKHMEWLLIIAKDEAVAKAADAARAAETPLMRMRRNLNAKPPGRAGQYSVAYTLDAANARAIDPLYTMARKHVDNLIDMGLKKLPFPIECFGRVFLTEGEPPYFMPHRRRLPGWDGDSGPMHVEKVIPGGVKTVDAELEEMRYGQPITGKFLYTWHMPALLLYDNDQGDICSVKMWHYGRPRDFATTTPPKPWNP